MADALKQANVNIAKVRDALSALRGKDGGSQGAKKVTNPMGDQTFEALKTYGRDLVEEAQQGRLDPVIGRDEEIRRVIRIVSRRTKVSCLKLPLCVDFHPLSGPKEQLQQMFVGPTPRFHPFAFWRCTFLVRFWLLNFILSALCHFFFDSLHSKTT